MSFTLKTDMAMSEMKKKQTYSSPLVAVSSIVPENCVLAGSTIYGSSRIQSVEETDYEW